MKNLIFEKKLEIFALTGIFFMFTFLAATQDIVVGNI